MFGVILAIAILIVAVVIVDNEKQKRFEQRGEHCRSYSKIMEQLEKSDEVYILSPLLKNGKQKLKELVESGEATAYNGEIMIINKVGAFIGKGTIFVDEK